MCDGWEARISNERRRKKVAGAGWEDDSFSARMCPMIPRCLLRRRARKERWEGGNGIGLGAIAAMNL